MKADKSLKLPPRQAAEWHPIERLLEHRRSIREFAPAALTRAELARLLWAAQGISDPSGLRTAPSAGALYPLEVYCALGDVEDLAAGVYRYQPRAHVLDRRHEGDVRAELTHAALGQECVGAGALVLAFTGVYERTTRKYGERGVRYVHMEAGHAAQNVCLQAASLGLGTVTIGAFDDEAVARILRLPEAETPLYLMPVGRP